MLEIAAPFEQTLSANVLVATTTGRPWYWLSTRSAAPPRSGPVASHRFAVNTLSITATRPPRTNTAPPPPPSYVSPVLSPCDEAHALDGQSWFGLVLAVRRGPHLRRITRVHVQDPSLPGAVEGDFATAIEHDGARGVHHLGGLGHHDRHRVGTAVEGDDAAGGHRGHDGLRRAATGRSDADHPVGVRRVERLRLGRATALHPGSRRAARCGPPPPSPEPTRRRR